MREKLGYEVIKLGTSINNRNGLPTITMIRISKKKLISNDNNFNFNDELNDLKRELKFSLPFQIVKKK